MKETRMTSIGCCAIVGEILGDRICVKTRAGNVRWLEKDAPVYQRGRFFDALFDDLLFADSNAPYHSFQSISCVCQDD